MNWYVILIIGVLVIVLITFLIFRNQKDEIDLEEKLNDEYTKPKHEHIDTDMDRKT
jgi:protein-S-isoprenylcysteine O-methyltransferase Ste14